MKSKLVLTLVAGFLLTAGARPAEARWLRMNISSLPKPAGNRHQEIAYPFVLSNTGFVAGEGFPIHYWGGVNFLNTSIDGGKKAMKIATGIDLFAVNLSGKVLRRQGAPYEVGTWTTLNDKACGTNATVRVDLGASQPITVGGNSAQSPTDVPWILQTTGEIRFFRWSTNCWARVNNVPVNDDEVPDAIGVYTTYEDGDLYRNFLPWVSSSWGQLFSLSNTNSSGIWTWRDGATTSPATGSNQVVDTNGVIWDYTFFNSTWTVNAASSYIPQPWKFTSGQRDSSGTLRNALLTADGVTWIDEEL